MRGPGAAGGPRKPHALAGGFLRACNNSPRRSQRGCAANKERIRAGSNQCLLVTTTALDTPCQKSKLQHGSVTTTISHVPRRCSGRPER
jgi:hypothetical protein